MSRRTSTRKSVSNGNNLDFQFGNLNLRESGVGVGRASVGQNRPSLRLSMAQSAAGRASMCGYAATIKDTRPIKDKRWQQQSIQRLIHFLVQSGFPHPLSVKSLSTPSSKDFKLIFKFLYAMLDPYYEFTKKFEEEVPVLIKALRYPFADQINKSNLFTVGSLHAWPTLLAMLLWIVDLVLSVEQLDERQAQGENQLPLSEVELADKMFFDYLCKAYAVWLKGDDETEVIDRTLLENFEKKDGKIKKDMERLQGEYNVLEKEWNTLSESESPLTIIQREKSILEGDKEKFKNYISHVQSKQQKLIDTCASLSKEFDASEETVKKLSKEREGLQETVDGQDLSPADVDRLNAERDQLAKSLALTSQNLDAITKQVWAQEIALQKKMDVLERTVDKVNALLYKLDVLGNTEPALECLSREIEVFVQQSRPESMVSVNLRSKVKPTLEDLIQQFKDTLVRLSDDALSMSEQVDTLSWNVSKKEEDLAQITSHIKTLQDQYVQEKNQVGSVIASACDELDSTERQLTFFKTQINSVSAATSLDLKKAKLEIETRMQLLSSNREDMMRQVVVALNTVFGFEQQVSMKLGEFESYVQAYQEEIDENLEAEGIVLH